MESPSRTLKREDYIPSNLPVMMIRTIEYFEFPYHSHDFIELAFISEGQGFNHLENQVQTVNSGQLIVMPIGISHVLRPTTTNVLRDRLVVYNCLFSTEILTSLSTIIIEPEMKEFFSTITNEHADSFIVTDINGHLAEIFAALYHEFAFTRIGNYTCLLSLLLRLLVEIFRLKKKDSTAIKEKTDHPEFMMALEYVEQSYGEEITLQHLADRTQWSVRQLQRFFHKHTGQSFRSYLQELRIRKSCEKLRNTQMKISNIANAVGYRDSNSFTAVFRRIMNCTPGAYRINENK